MGSGVAYLGPSKTLYKNLLGGPNGGFIILAPAPKKTATGSISKLGTGSIGKPSSQIGKTSSFGSTSKSSSYSSSAKNAKLTGSEKTASFFGSTAKDSYFGSSGSNKTSNDKHNSFGEATGKSSNILSASVKTSSVPESSKYSNTLQASDKSYSKAILPAYSGKTDSTLISNTKNSNVLGSTGKYSNVSLVKNETKTPFSGKSETNPLSTTKNSNVFGSYGKQSSSPIKNDGMLASTGLAANMLLSSGTNSNKLSSAGNYSNVGSSSKKDTSTSKVANVLLSSGTNSNVLGSSGKYMSPYGSSGKNDSVLGTTAKSSVSNNSKQHQGKINNAFKPSQKDARPMAPTNTNSNVHDSSKLYPSFMTPKEKKPTSRFGIIWLPLRKRNKKKDNIVHNPHNYENYNRAPSMYNYMSGDSSDHQSHKKKEEETLLVPERAKHTAVAVNTGITAASIDMPPDGSGSADPEEKHEFIKHDSEESKEASGDNEKSKIDNDYLENTDDLVNNSPDSKWDKEKQGDKVDSVYLRPPPPHKARSTASSNEEESCGMKCLYYTLQCCDCILM
ncbi:unnamed protein product [Diatraea saccharalis]|uniref:Uncharacterized protein n=1 Tax=Diatraea saccharalis TaxID=40085 RepID=A0A9N9QPH8_9NEOP|nr:unnamed protein product [Diatraea saccharalis]